jgi:hypothetical protein
MAIAKQSLVASEVSKALHALSGDARDYDPLLRLIHGARFCLLGEATHGTYEFYCLEDCRVFPWCFGRAIRSIKCFAKRARLAAAGSTLSR